MFDLSKSNYCMENVCKIFKIISVIKKLDKFFSKKLKRMSPSNECDVYNIGNYYSVGEFKIIVN